LLLIHEIKYPLILAVSKWIFVCRVHFISANLVMNKPQSTALFCCCTFGRLTRISLSSSLVLYSRDIWIFKESVNEGVTVIDSFIDTLTELKCCWHDDVKWNADTRACKLPFTAKWISSRHDVTIYSLHQLLGELVAFPASNDYLTDIVNCTHFCFALKHGHIICLTA
jgi:hypothetical protein